VTSSLKAQQRIGATERKRNSCSIGGRERARERQNRLIEGCRSEPFGRIHSHYAASPEAMMSHRDGAVSGGATAFGYRPAVNTRWGVCVTLLQSWGQLRCDPKAKQLGKRPPDAQCLPRKHMIKKNESITSDSVMHGPRWRKDARISTSLMSRRSS